jgi:hypothetical protein
MKRRSRTVKWWIFLPLVPVFLSPAFEVVSRFWFSMHIDSLGRLYSELALLGAVVTLPNIICAVALYGPAVRTIEHIWFWVLLIPALLFCALLYVISLALQLYKVSRLRGGSGWSLSREQAQGLAVIFPALGALCFLIAAASGLHQSASMFPPQRIAIEWFVAAVILAALGGLFFAYARSRSQNI